MRICAHFLNWLTRTIGFFSWDLKSGYHQEDIWEHHQQYLGFHGYLEIDSKRLYFSFSVAPIGLSSARFCFTKLMRPQVKRWQPRAYLSFIYLNDGHGGQPEKISAAAASIIHCRERFTVSCSSTSWQVSTCPLQITLRLSLRWR